MQRGSRPATASTTRLVLFAHGSADPGWKQPFEALTASLRTLVGPSRIRLAFMQLAAPSLSDVAAEAHRDRVACLRVLPLFLAPGAHVRRDVPAQMHALAGRYPDIAFELLPAVGTDPRMTHLLTTLAREAVAPPAAGDAPYIGPAQP